MTHYVTISKLSRLVMSAMITLSAHAEPIWHCSRVTENDQTQISNSAQREQFSIASFNNVPEAISVSVRDLLDIYSGNPVRVGGLMLSACFLTHHNLTQSALMSLGIQPKTIEALARRNAIVQNNLHHVSNELEMSECITKNFPAVGYLSNPSESQKIIPCF